MKINKFICVVAMLAMSIGLWAQYSSKQYVVRPTETIIHCQDAGLPYIWREKEIYTDGTYRDTVHTYWEEDKDTIYVVKFTLSQIVRKEFVFQMPQGDSIRWREKKYTQAGVYYDTISSPYTCDTIEKITINYAKKYEFFQSYHSCGKTEFDWHGIHIDEAKEYSINYKTKEGVDSIYRLAVFYDDTLRHTYDTIVACKDKIPYMWNGVKLYEECDTIRWLKSKYGCDSVAHLHLILKKSPERTKVIVNDFCAGDGYFTHGIQVHRETMFTDTLASYCGCDSIVDSLITPYPGSFFREELHQHFPKEEFEWRGRVYKTDGYYYDTIPNIGPGPTSEGCDSIYMLHLVTKYHMNVYRSLCYGDTAEYKSPQGKIIITHDTTITEYHLSILGGDSLVDFEFRYSPKIIIKVDSITICGNEKYEWVYDETHKKTIDGANYRNQSKVSVTAVEMKLGKCEVAQMIVTVVPYALNEQTVIKCNEEVADNPYVWYDHNHKKYEFTKPNMDVTIYDTINHPNFHEPGQDIEMGECDSIFKFRFISTDRCSSMDYYYLCPNESIKIDNKWYNKTGSYSNKMPSKVYAKLNLQDSTHFFTILPAKPDTLTYSITRCESAEPTEYMGQFYKRTQEDTIHVPYTNQTCDSLLIFVHVEAKPTRISKVIYKDFCSNEQIYVPTGSGKVLTTSGHHTDTIPMSYDMGCDSITQYFIRTHEATNKVDSAYIRHGEQYKWTIHGKDTILTEAGIYEDKNTTTTYGCDSNYTLILNWNEPYYELTEDTACSNYPYTWRGNNYYETTNVFDTVYHSTRDAIYELRLKVNDPQTVWRYIHLLPDTSYNFHGHILTLAQHMNKTVADTVASITTGCDSINKITILPVEPVVIDTILCPNQYIIVNGDTIEHNYSDTTCVDGDWSVRIYSITRSKAIIYEKQIQISVGESYIWQRCTLPPLTISEAGTYLDSCVNQYGCDSITRLKVVIARPQSSVQTIDYCYRDLPYMWHGQALYNTNLYTYNDKTALGQALTDSLYFIVQQPIHANVYIDTCDLGYPITINGKQYHKNCAFVDTLTAKSTHCDSIVHYILNFHTPPKIVLRKQISEGETFHWRGQDYTTTGQYPGYGEAKDGCDTVFTLFLNVCPNRPVQYQTIHACEGEIVRVNGDTIRESKTIDVYHQDDNGCEYVEKVIVKFHNSFFSSKTDSIYPGGVYTWRGQTFTRPGTYFDSLATFPYGCDSVYSVTWHFSQLTTSSTKKVICQDSVPFQHKGYGAYFHDTVFVDTILNARGWPTHLHSWIYEISERCSDYDIYYLCPGESKEIEGLIIDTAGYYSVQRQTAQGKDSLYRFKVLPAKRYEKDVHLTGCDSIVYSGKTFYSHGTDEPYTYTMEHKTTHGCDSIEHLILTIHSSKQRTNKVTIADFEVPYYFAGQPFSTTGQYPITFYTQPYGCDSIVILDLKVQPTINDTTIMYYCKGDLNGVTVFGKKYFPETRLTIDSIFRSGDYPVRKTVIVEVNQPFTITKFEGLISEDSIVCASNLVQFHVRYEVKDPDKGALPTHYDVQFKVGDLDAHPKTATYEVKGKSVLPIYMDGLGTSVHPGRYSYLIQFRSDGCPVSDTTFEGNVLVRYPAEIMESNWNNVVALVNEKYNAGQWRLQPPYAWQVWDSNGREKTSLVSSNSNIQPYIASDSLRENDIVVATLYREDYPYPIPSCPFVFKPVNFNGTHPILVHPTVTHKASKVHVETDSEGEYQLYAPTGRKCNRGAIMEGDNAIYVPAVTGCYLLQVTLKNGAMATKRIIVE